MAKKYYPQIFLVGLSMGVFLSSSTYAQQNTGWNVACLSPQVCELKSEIFLNEIVAARVSVVNIRGQLILQYTLPLGIDISQGILISIDEGPGFQTRLVNCTDLGCIGTIDLTSEIVQSMKGGNNLNLLYTAAQNQDTFSIPFSLSGFTAGFSELVAG